MPDNQRQQLPAQFMRFLGVGTVNTVLAWSVYWMALQVVHHQWAFIVTYITSLAFSVVAHSRLSFGLHLRSVGFAAYAAYSLGMYVFGAAMLELIVRTLGIGPTAAIAVLTVVQLPVNFICSRWLMTRFARHTPRSAE